MPLSLKKTSGLDIAVNTQTFEITFGEKIEVGKKSIRVWKDMQDFVEEPDAQPTRNEIYYVFRNIARPIDIVRMSEHVLRYDITIIPPGVFVSKQKEFFRTAGHYHPLKAGASTAYPEIYEVLSGRAQFFLQRPDPANAGILAETYVVEAGPGEKVMMMPGFGHISVNTEAVPLVLSNWISDTFQYDYEAYRKFRGGGYRLVEGFVENTVEFLKNHRYDEVPEIIKLRPKELPEFGLIWKKPMYELVQDTEKLAFLDAPEKFPKSMTVEHCFRY